MKGNLVASTSQTIALAGQVERFGLIVCEYIERTENASRVSKGRERRKQYNYSIAYRVIYDKFRELFPSDESQPATEAVMRDKAVNDFASCECPIWGIQERHKGKWELDPIGFFFTAEEAAQEIKDRPYAYKKSARPYGFFAKGQLRKILSAHTVDNRGIQP